MLFISFIMALKLALVVPCYNEESILDNSLKRLLKLLHSLYSEKIISHESAILCVDDGSIDSTWEIIETFSASFPNVSGIKLARNVGHQNALLAGLTNVLDYDISITIDADLQDDISVIKSMIEKANCDCDIVYGVRSSRDADSFIKKKSAQLFYDLMQNSGTEVIPNHADFRLMSKRAVEKLLTFSERNLFLRGIVPLIGFKSDIVYYERKPRNGGKTKYPFMNMLSLAIEGITSFSVRPIRLIFTVGLIFLIITLTVTIYVVISILLGNSYPGWASLMLSLWFIGSLVLMALGIIGEYVSKIYLEVKHRPRFFIEKKSKEKL